MFCSYIVHQWRGHGMRACRVLLFGVGRDCWINEALFACSWKIQEVGEYRYRLGIYLEYFNVVANFNRRSLLSISKGALGKCEFLFKFLEAIYDDININSGAAFSLQQTSTTDEPWICKAFKVKSNQLEPKVLAYGTIGRVKPLSPPSKIRSLLKMRELIRDVDFICNYLGIRDWTLNLDLESKGRVQCRREEGLEQIGTMVQDWPGLPVDLHSCKSTMRATWSLPTNLRMRSPWSLRSWMERRVVIDFALYKNACDFDQQLPGYHYQILLELLMLEKAKMQLINMTM